MAKFIKVKKFPSLEGFLSERDEDFYEMEEDYWYLFDYAINTDHRLGSSDVEDIILYFSSLPDKTVYWGKIHDTFYFTFYSPKELLEKIEEILNKFEKANGKID